MIDIETYLNKVFKGRKPIEAAVNVQHEKKYCSSFVNGDDGYCVNYIKPEPIECAIKISDNSFMTVKVYTPAVVNCSGQCYKVN